MAAPYARFATIPWIEFGKNLLTEKGAQQQRDFLQACLSKRDFQQHIEQSPLSLNREQGDPIPFSYRFTEAEFYNPCKDSQEAIWNAFNGIDKETAADDCFWGKVVMDMIEKKQIEPAWLAADGKGAEEEGRHRIERLLQSDANKDTDSNHMDSCVRRVLRSLCHRAPRRKRIIFYDFPLGRVWWRRHWADRMAEKLSRDREKILETMDETNYKLLAEKLYSGKSYLGADNVFGGLLLFLEKAPVKGDKLKDILDRLAYLSAWKAIELQSPEENCDEISRIFECL